MLSKELRLEKKEIPQIAKKGKRFDNEYFFTRAWFDDSLSKPQFAISISVKIDKRSAIRNRIKRKLRASIMDLVSESPDFRKGKYLIIVKSRDLLDLDNSKISEAIKKVIV